MAMRAKRRANRLGESVFFLWVACWVGAGPLFGAEVNKEDEWRKKILDSVQAIQTKAQQRTQAEIEARLRQEMEAKLEEEVARLERETAAEIEAERARLSAQLKESVNIEKTKFERDFEARLAAEKERLEQESLAGIKAREERLQKEWQEKIQTIRSESEAGIAAERIRLAEEAEAKIVSERATFEQEMQDRIQAEIAKVNQAWEAELNAAGTGHTDSEMPASPPAGLTDSLEAEKNKLAQAFDEKLKDAQEKMKQESLSLISAERERLEREADVRIQAELERMNREQQAVQAGGAADRKTPADTEALSFESRLEEERKRIELAAEEKIKVEVERLEKEAEEKINAEEKRLQEKAEADILAAKDEFRKVVPADESSRGKSNHASPVIGIVLILLVAAGLAGGICFYYMRRVKGGKSPKGIFIRLLCKMIGDGRGFVQKITEQSSSLSEISSAMEKLLALSERCAVTAKQVNAAAQEFGMPGSGDLVREGTKPDMQKLIEIMAKFSEISDEGAVETKRIKEILIRVQKLAQENEVRAQSLVSLSEELSKQIREI